MIFWDLQYQCKVLAKRTSQVNAVCNQCRLHTSRLLAHIVLLLQLLRANHTLVNQSTIQANWNAIQANRAIQANQSACLHLLDTLRLCLFSTCVDWWASLASIVHWYYNFDQVHIFTANWPTQTQHKSMQVSLFTFGADCSMYMVDWNGFFDSLSKELQLKVKCTTRCHFHNSHVLLNTFIGLLNINFPILT